MRIIFAGTPQIAADLLEQLITKYSVVACYTQPDRAKGRGQQLSASPVKQLANKHHIPVLQPKKLTEKDASHIKQQQADLLIVVAFGLILPKVILQAPRLGCINVHFSLLPRWRGAAPIQHAILAGDQSTGITIMQMDEGLDTGPILNSSTCQINDSDTSTTLYTKLQPIAVASLLQTLEQLTCGNSCPTMQDDSKANYAAKITKQNARLDWGLPAATLSRMVRAFIPSPIAFTQLADLTIRIWQATAIATSTTASPGSIINITANSIDVATGNGVLQIQKMQFPGKKPMMIADILNSKKHLLENGKFN